MWTLKAPELNCYGLYEARDITLSCLDHFKLPSATKSLIELLYHIVHPTATTVILGDFNLPFIDWHSHSARNDGVSNCFLDCFLNLGLHQFVLEPTRINHTGVGNILDIILCNDQSAINLECINNPLSTGDHCIVDFLLHFPLSTPNTGTDHALTDHSDQNSDFTVTQHGIKLHTYDWIHGNYSAINDYIFSLDWHQVFGYNFDVETIWSSFKGLLWPIISMFVPQKLVSHKFKYRPRQYPKSIRILLCRKAAIWRKLRTVNSTQVWNLYKQISQECRQAVLKFDIDRESKILETNNLGAFFKFVNKSWLTAAD